ncbi:MAG: LysR family transcriptional regulator [Hyphomicrobiales bacterium]|nr:LysR family transcriptional regulator [Hyphomicrobiales bacterium]MCP4999327.1 LysR family transcriptional regulator [Hyphomicrobiales bacterium]
MLIDPRHLEQLAAIVEHGTLHEAAKRLGTSQPALSRMISNLEIRLGVQLFERSSRPLLPTEIGQKLAHQGRAIRAIRQRAYEDVQLGMRGMSGELKIGAPPFLCERLVGEAISGFVRQRPKIEVKLISDYFPRLERKALLNQIDVVICPLKLLSASKEELSAEPLFWDEHVVVGRQDHPLSKLKQITADDLEAATWISHSEHSLLHIDMATALASFGVANLTIAFQSESAASILEMLRTTDFLTVLPRYAIRNTEPEGGLSILPVRFASSSMTVGMVTSQARLESPLLAAFASHMRDYVAKDLSEGFKLKPKETSAGIDK